MKMCWFMFLLLCLSTTADIHLPNCPHPYDLLPCTCDYEGINCAKVHDASQLRTVLNSFVADTRFRDFWMSETQLTTIGSNTFKRYRILRLHIHYNKLLENISDDAFAIQNFTSELEIVGSRFRSIPLVALSPLKGLSHLDLSENMINSIPDNAFRELPLLDTILLANNRIGQIGKRAFASLSHVSVVDLSANQLTVIQDETFLNSNLYSFRILDLEGNNIHKIQPSAFEVFGTLRLVNNKISSFDKDTFGCPLKILSKRAASFIDVTDNPIACDATLLWLLEFPKSTRLKIKGITCHGKGIGDIQLKDLQTEQAITTRVDLIQ